MRSFVIFLIGFSYASHLCAQQKIDMNNLGKHIGDSVAVCGKIYGGKYLESAANQPTLLNMGAAYPNQPLTLVIWGATRKNFSYIPEKDLANKNVCVRGRVELFKGKPQVIIKEEKQIMVQSE